MIVRQISSARSWDVAMEIGPRIAEGSRTQPHEAGDVPFFKELRVGVEIDREIEEVRYERDCLAAFGQTRRLQNIETLDDQNIGVVGVNELAR